MSELLWQYYKTPAEMCQALQPYDLDADYVTMQRKREAQERGRLWARAAAEVPTDKARLLYQRLVAFEVARFDLALHPNDTNCRRTLAEMRSETIRFEQEHATTIEQVA